MTATERRNLTRRTFSYYMRVIDDATGNLVGHLSDIGTGGFKLDSKYPIPVNKDFTLRIDQTGEISNKNFVTFTARSRWCRFDELDMTLYNVGFQLVNISQIDYDIFLKMFNTYGKNETHPDND